MNKYYDVPEQVINAIKINPYDDKVFATLSRLSGTIQMWRDNFGTHIWKHRNSVSFRKSIEIHLQIYEPLVCSIQTTMLSYLPAC